MVHGIGPLKFYMLPERPASSIFGVQHHRFLTGVRTEVSTSDLRIAAWIPIVPAHVWMCQKNNELQIVPSDLPSSAANSEGLCMWMDE